MTARRLELTMWVGVLGSGLSWALMFLFGYGLSIATCNRFVSGRTEFQGPSRLPFDTWTLIGTAIGAALAILGIVAAIATFRASRSPELDLTGMELDGKGSPPPVGRVHFMSIIGMLVSPLFLCIILLSGLGSFVLSTCNQS